MVQTIGMTPNHLLVAVSAVLTPEQAKRLADADPRMQILWQADMYPPQRFTGDFGGDPAWRRPPELQAQFDAMCDQANALFGVPDYRPSQLRRCAEANPGLLWVHTVTAGGGAQVKAAKLAAADLDRITFTTSAGPHAATLAEFAMFGVLAGAKRLPDLQRDQRAHIWDETMVMRHVKDMTVAVVGMGNIGRLVAQRFLMLGAKVMGVNRTVREVPGVEMHPDHDLASVAAKADALINCLPGTAETEHLIGADVLAGAKPGLIVVSLGRGSCIDEAALIDQLRSGRVGFAALDVVDREPLAPDSPLWDLPNVLISPHNMAFGPHIINEVIDLFIENAKALLDGRPLRNVMNKDAFY